MLELNTIHLLDCISAMKSMPAGSVDLAFADPPFNIGYSYDVYNDKKDAKAYLNWSREWISKVHRVLKPNGAFWLAIGDEYAAELKIISQEAGFHCRSWVVWYYTFGVHCKKKFSRSHVHIFHFVKDPKNYQFNAQAVAVPSARQLVYADSRAAAGGRMPDDTWILRPQDLPDGFSPDDDTWYFPRVAGTFKEREGFHGCQMPEQLLGRIIKVSSSPGDLILDPFSGSSTTLVVAKKLERKFVGFDISDDYVKRGLMRLDGCASGDRLEGSPEPTVSAPATPKSEKATKRAQRKKVAVSEPVETVTVKEEPTEPIDIDDLVIEAFRKSSDGYSADRVVADPKLDEQFLKECTRQGIDAKPAIVNRTLFRLRKAGKLKSIPTTQRTEFPWEETDNYLFASEIAWRQIHDRTQVSMDEMLCDPELASQFDQIAGKFAPGYSSLQYRWAILKMRKVQKIAGNRSASLSHIELPESWACDNDKKLSKLKGEPGLYMVYGPKNKALYAGETFDLGRRLKNQFGSHSKAEGWTELKTKLRVSAIPYRKLTEQDEDSIGAALGTLLVAYQMKLVLRDTPLLNSLGMEMTV